ncbi:putative glycosyltransferase [Mesorhizobium albiziae]|uniref:Putative glycosyltransferase n=1 Tax=Neomesorhizobium albiziae TaxID=335020 RepID=A0A1I4DUB4_9HYPH|nr:glycosyltransferase family 2 protein [Mesorhizobium albiziae]GLS32782.1 putative glycosyltransferases [Mesorhizobium albiziae]SFK97212.1 putative glycosyltransferase [Mesorhizobium albiziae]
MRISVVTPLYRSAPYLEELYQRTVAAIEATGAGEHEIIFVNDCGPDNSLEVAKEIAARDPSVIVVDLSRNFGQHRAILIGLEHSSGDLTFVMDSDLEEEPEWITLFYEAMTTRGVDVVYGVLDTKKGGSVYRMARRIFYTVLNSLSDFGFPENVVTARLMSRRYIDALQQFGEREVYLAGIWHVAGFAQLPVRVKKLDTSTTTYTLTRAAGLFINAVTAFSTRPLISIAVAGICLSAVAFAYTLWITLRRMFWGVAVEGWTSTMAATLIIGGLTLFFNGIMAIYIAKIFIEVKQRPRVIVREVHRAPSKKAQRRPQ